jgi:hypothetical protein
MGGRQPESKATTWGHSAGSGDGVKHVLYIRDDEIDSVHARIAQVLNDAEGHLS